MAKRYSQPQAGPAQIDRSTPFGNRRWACVYVPSVTLFGDAKPAGTYSSNTTLGVSSGGKSLKNSGALINGGGFTFGANAGMLLSTHCGVVVFRAMGVSTQALFDMGYGGAAPGTGAFLLAAYPTSVSIIKKDTVVVKDSVNAPVVGAVNTVAWSYNATTGRGRIALNGVLTSFTVVQTFTSVQASLGGYWTDFTTGNAANEHFLFALSPDECFSDQALIDASKNPWALFKPANQALFSVAAGGSVSGAPIWTEVNDTYSITSNFLGLTSGSINWSEGHDSFSLSGSIISSGVINWLESNDAYSITGNYINGSSGIISWGDSNDIYTISSTIKYSGSISLLDSNDLYDINGNSYSPTTGTISWIEADTYTMTGSGGIVIPPLGGVSFDGGVSYVNPKKVIAGTGIIVVETSSGYVISVA